MSRRTWTLLASVVLVAVFGLLGGFARVPYVAIGPGPTFNTLGAEDGRPVIRIDGHRTYPTGGQLNLTTVSLTDHLSMFGALGLWASGRYQLVPREVYFPPNKSEKQIRRQNTRAFKDSQTTAETAALHHLDYPMKVIAGEIVKGAPADRALQPGDQLLAANGRPVTDVGSLQGALRGTAPGEQVTIRFRRGDEPARTVQVRLARHPRGSQGFLGVVPELRPDVGFDIDISLTDVGGPSAGLMFALGIVDKLTPGQLNGGEFVAGTGEITPRGDVGPIGGIQFKMVKAREKGATTFLVPEGNCAVAKATVPEGLRLVKVSTLDDATRALAALRAGRTPEGC